MSNKKEYVPPMAEAILLSPCEELAYTDWAFGSAWKSKWGKFTDTNGASGFAFGGGSFTETEEDGDFFFKQSS